MDANFGILRNRNFTGDDGHGFKAARAGGAPTRWQILENAHDQA
jgi:hypothetical protein